MKYITGSIITQMIVMIIIPTFAMAEVFNVQEAKALLEAADLSRGNVSGVEWDIDIKTQTADRIQKNVLRVKVKGVNSLAIYKSPVKVRGRKLLMKNRNMWFIKPGLSKPVPISPRQKLLGGASNGDIASTNYAGDYIIEKFNPDEFNGKPRLLFDLKAKNKKVTYDRIRYWVSLSEKTGLRAEFFTMSGKQFKTAVFEYDHTIMNNGIKRPFVSKMIISNAMVKTDKTIMVYQNISIKDVPASSFNLSLLVR